MGLDTYAARSSESELPAEDQQVFDEAGLMLCGGLNSGSGGSFRGKVYADVIEHVSGISLYEEWIPPNVVQAMAEAFEHCDPEVVEAEMEDSAHPASAVEVGELRRFFRICADRGLGLVGWS